MLRCGEPIWLIFFLTDIFAVNGRNLLSRDPICLVEVRLRQVFLAGWVFPVKGLPPQQVMSGSDGGGVSNGAKLKTIQESSKLKNSDGSGGGSTGSVKNIYKSLIISSHFQLREVNPI